MENRHIFAGGNVITAAIVLVGAWALLAGQWILARDSEKAKLSLQPPRSTEVVSSSPTIYSEDFASDPNYTIVYSSNTQGEADVHWDESQENFYAKVKDQSNEWYSVGLSPTFQTVQSEDEFAISFQFNPVEPDWGHYPGIYFVSSNPDANPRDLERAIQFTINWSDHTYKTFQLRNAHGERYVSSTIPSADEWYDVLISYDPSSQTVDDQAPNVV